MSITIDGKEFAQGCVLAIEVNHRYDTISDYDYYTKRALYFDPVKNQPIWVGIDTNYGSREFTGPNTATVDADDDTKKMYLSYLTQSICDDLVRREQEYNDRIEVGCQVQVVRGRNVPKGAKGKVVHSMLRPYGQGFRPSNRPKICIATSDVMIDVVGKNGKTYKNHKDVVWVWEHNCDRIDSKPANQNEALRRAQEMATEQFNKICTV